MLKDTRLPADGHRDTLGREFSDICGYSDILESTPIPVGSTVRLLGDRIRPDYPELVGRSAIVLEYYPRARNCSLLQGASTVFVRLVTPRSEFDYPSDNQTSWPTAWIELLTVGDGTVVPGSYQLTEREIWDERFATRDHRHEGWSNPRTFEAALYLEADRPHHERVLSFVRKDGSINPDRLRNYFRRSALQLGEWSQYPAGFPERSRWAYPIDWNEIAQHFAQTAKESRQAA